jgi:hypothetical protein
MAIRGWQIGAMAQIDDLSANAQDPLSFVSEGGAIIRSI